MSQRTPAVAIATQAGLVGKAEIVSMATWVSRAPNVAQSKDAGAPCPAEDVWSTDGSGLLGDWDVQAATVLGHDELNCFLEESAQERNVLRWVGN